MDIFMVEVLWAREEQNTSNTSTCPTVCSHLNDLMLRLNCSNKNQLMLSTCFPVNLFQTYPTYFLVLNPIETQNFSFSIKHAGAFSTKSATKIPWQLGTITLSRFCPKFCTVNYSLPTLPDDIAHAAFGLFGLK